MKLSTLFCLFSCLFLNCAYASLTEPSINQWNGDEYHQNAQLQAQWADRFFFKNYRFLGNENVLDIGCGDGKICARIANAVNQGKVLGIDNSASMLNVALKEYADIANLHFEMMDAQNPTFYAKHVEEFDVIVSFVTLHWIKDQNTVLHGVHQALKPKGRFYFKLCSKSRDPIQEIADTLAKGAYKSYFKGYVEPITRYNAKEYQTLLEKAHLKVLSIQDVEEKDTIQGKERLIKQIKSWLPHYHYLKHQSPKIAEQYIQLVINMYLLEHPASNDGEITLYDHYLEVIGQKEG